jgi:hypothetical protein
MHIVADLTIEALRERCPLVLTQYENALIAACDRFPPPFGSKSYGDVYRRAASEPEWLAMSLLANAEREGDGSARLWNLAGSTPDPDLASELRQHAVDESRHSRWYVAMFDVAFPDALDPELRPYADAFSPGYTLRETPSANPDSPFSHAITLDDLIQMNIAEIRTRIHHLLQRPMLSAHCSSDRRSKLQPLMDKLLYDETSHVHYTAARIEQHIRSGSADAFDLMAERLNDFNIITHEELGEGTFAVT